MHIEFTETGGIGYFPGLNKPVAVDVDRLDKNGAEVLKRLVEAAHFFDLPANIGVPPRGAADYQQYILAIEDQGRRHTVRVLVPVEDPVLRDLVQAVQKYARAILAERRGVLSNPTVDKKSQ